MNAVNTELIVVHASLGVEEFAKVLRKARVVLLSTRC
jgi:hypothetical protein